MGQIAAHHIYGDMVCRVVLFAAYLRLPRYEHITRRATHFPDYGKKTDGDDSYRRLSHADIRRLAVGRLVGSYGSSGVDATETITGTRADDVPLCLLVAGEGI